jgi:FMN reductase
MAHVLAVSASPSVVSRTAAVLDLATAALRVAGHSVDLLALREIPAQPLLHNDQNHPALWDAADRLERADAVILGTPVYKSAYSGLLKVWLDSIGRYALAGRAVLALVTGASVTNRQDVDHALLPVLAAAGDPLVLPGVFVLDRAITVGDGVVLDAQARADLDDAISRLANALACVRPAAA